MNQETTLQLSGLFKTMRRLRSETGCPWDRGQTPESLTPYILEEAYELVDAINSGDTQEILSELGDLLLQVVFQAQIHTERNLFGIGEIAEGINLKLQRRHPQIFCNNPEITQFPDWEQVKQQELKECGKPTDFLTRQPKNLPALKLADKCHAQLLKNSEIDSRPAKQNDSTSQKNEEHIAASLYALVGQARRQGIDCESALRKYVLQQFPKENKNG